MKRKHKKQSYCSLSFAVNFWFVTEIIRISENSRFCYPYLSGIVMMIL